MHREVDIAESVRGIATVCVCVCMCVFGGGGEGG